MIRRRRLALTAAAASLVGLLAPAWLLGAATLAPPAAAMHPSDRGESAAQTPAQRRAEKVFQKLTPAQRIGQLFMVGTPATGLSGDAVSVIEADHVGSVILTGRGYGGVTATKAVTDAIQQQATAAATHGVRFLVGADQEGGNVQVLRGPGFSAIPTALTQGSWPRAVLRSRAKTWGGQLRAAGVNLDLAPVLDTVPASLGRGNAPIGYWHREFGHTPAAVTAHGVAVVRGLQAAGIAVTLKHFPGLGRVHRNTDTSAGVTDDVTAYDDPYLAPYSSGINAGAAFVMMSTAYYHRIDRDHPAAFSSRIIRGMLRGELGFGGVVVSDDLGAAAEVASWSPGARAVDFIAAGGDLVLTVTPSVIPEMVQQVTDRAQASTAFRHEVDAAVLRVLTAKAALGLL